jgi:hypothetical protein
LGQLFFKKHLYLGTIRNKEVMKYKSKKNESPVEEGKGYLKRLVMGRDKIATYLFVRI